MSELSRLSVEVFHDRESPFIPSYITAFGIKSLQNIVKDIELIRGPRYFDLALDAEGSVSMETTDWNRLSADLNVVMTQRTIATERKRNNVSDESYVLGRAYNARTRGIARVAVVNVMNRNPEDTLVHELAHLLDVPHCARRRCLMHEAESTRWTQSFCRDCCVKLIANTVKLSKAKSGE